MDEMPKMPNYTPEELVKMQVEALQRAQEALAKLTPEERAQAEEAGKRLLEEEARKHQEMWNTISRSSAQSKAKETAQDAQKPKFCPNCGTPVSGGKFCGNCGQAL